MGDGLKWKPPGRRKRLIFSSETQRSFPEHQGKVFAIIGPIEREEIDLENMLTTVIRGYNLEPRGPSKRKPRP